MEFFNRIGSKPTFAAKCSKAALGRKQPCPARQDWAETDLRCSVRIYQNPMFIIVDAFLVVQPSQATALRASSMSLPARPIPPIEFSEDNDKFGQSSWRFATLTFPPMEPVSRSYAVSQLFEGICENDKTA